MFPVVDGVLQKGCKSKRKGRININCIVRYLISNVVVSKTLFFVNKTDLEGMSGFRASDCKREIEIFVAELFFFFFNFSSCVQPVIHLKKVPKESEDMKIWGGLE